MVQWPWRAHCRDGLEICCPSMYSLLSDSKKVLRDWRSKVAYFLG
jgi:hypothetical protein